MSLPETRLKHRLSKINVHTLSGERVHSISKTLMTAQGGFLKKNFTPENHRFSLPSRYSRVTFATTGESSTSAIRFGNAINPFMMSAIPHTADIVR